MSTGHGRKRDYNERRSESRRRARHISAPRATARLKRRRAKEHFPLPTTTRISRHSTTKNDQDGDDRIAPPPSSSMVRGRGFGHDLRASAAGVRRAVRAGNTGSVQHYQLHGSGTTNPSKLIWLAMDKLEEMAGSTLRMTYRSVGSGTGASDWADSTNAGDFASTDYGLAA